MTIDNISDGAFGTILIRQDATGGRTLTIVCEDDSSGSLTEIYVDNITAIDTGTNAYSAIEYKRLGSIVIIEIKTF
jgi:hypothetical protein